MATNLNNTTPAAPSGGVNVLWQQDGSGNTSAYLPLTGTKTTVAPVAGVLTINATLGNSFLITVNAAITSMSISGPTDGQEITLLFAQDSTGHAVTLAANIAGATAVSTTANTHSVMKLTYNVGNTIWYNIPSNGV